ncbi:large conductance mechanosensitive channel protein MscL [Atopobacter sp. AH10]|uniref:large conductance mechanosensitive channel protein MscL n=1 Tax=Atopobacter sp. AH10 TaxID=2315861 RepID=UPI000EF237A3|nr:large conductance mechanosensitive channel protein MscL [Atopobacter sp. AH10]RLK62752.1 large conductance mechanosensitive channel protein MscL [Atopobacter sp. AH10]
MLKEFKDFLMRGNVMDLAVGVIIGAAFKAIVDSLVADLIMPIINALTGSTDVTDLSLKIGVATLKYGNFLQAVINFVIIGFVLFVMVKAVNTAQERLAGKKDVEEVAEAKPTAEDYLRDIRDLLSKK